MIIKIMTPIYFGILGLSAIGSFSGAIMLMVYEFEYQYEFTYALRLTLLSGSMAIMLMAFWIIYWVMNYD
jgi:hypothetical protein